MIRRKGFSLMDVLVATAVTGMGVAAAVYAVGETGQTSSSSREQMAAVNLAQHIHELAMSLPHSNPDGTMGLRTSSDATTFNDLYDLHNWTSTKVVNSSGATIDGYPDWQQSVQVFGVDPANPQVNLTAPTRTGLKRVVVSVKYRGSVVHTENWFLAPVLK